MHPREHRDFRNRGRGPWTDTATQAEWDDWGWQMRNRLTSLESLEKLLTLSREEREGCLFAKDKLALAITPYFFNLIDRDNPACPVRRQVIPRIEESYVNAGEMLDPVGEEHTMPVPGLVHRYPDRVLFLVTDRCASYCRYCTRSRLVSNAQHYDFHPEHEAALKYIADHPEVRDVLLSGGDPLMLSDGKLDYILGRLRAIPHVEFIRIGSRIPVFMPQRITPALCSILEKHGPIWMSIHVNHADEISSELYDACERLVKSGTPLGNQSVLLAGVNDDPEVMKRLVQRLIMMRVRPYYIYACDLITGSAHLRAPVEKGLEIIRALRGHTTGYAVPQFVIDAPGGGGKVPVNPTYIDMQSLDTDTVRMTNFEGREFAYPAK